MEAQNPFLAPITLRPNNALIKPIVPVSALVQWGVASVGVDNTYYDYAKAVVARSATATACYEVCMRFGFGMGFSDDRTANLIIAPAKDYFSSPTTMDKWLERMLSDLILYGGHAALVQLDKGGREIINIYPTAFTQWRKGYKGSGLENTALRWDNWAGENPQGSISDFTPNMTERYALFGAPIEIDSVTGFPKPQLIYLQRESIGEAMYPNVPYNGALPFIDMEGGTGRAMNNAMANGFHAAYFATIGADLTPDGQAAMLAQLYDMQGVDGNGGVLFTTATGANVTPIRDASSDGRYKEDLAIAQRYIAGAFGVPTQLLPFERTGSLGNSQEMKTAIALMQGYAEKMRSTCIGWMGDVLRYASPKIYGAVNFEILPLEIEIPT